MTEKKHIHDVAGLNARLQAITRRARIDMRYLHDDRSRQHIVAATRDCTRILDVGAGMRDHLGALAGRVETLDLNDFGDDPDILGPDILGDVCSPFPDWMEARYDAGIDRLEPYTQRLLREGDDDPDRLALWVRALLLGGRFDQAVSIVEPLFGDEAWRRQWLALARVVDISTAAEALNVIEPSMLREGADLLRLAVAFDALAVRSAGAEYFDRADALALRAARDPKHAVDALLVRGRIAEGRADWTAAEQLYRRVISDQPDNAAALNNLAFVIAQSPARSSEALPYVERAVALQPQQPDILDTYATVLHGLGRLDEAHEALTRALARRPADVAIRLNLVETILAQGRLDDAWRMLQRIERTLSRRPQGDPRHLRRAEALRRRLNDAQAAAAVSDPQ